MQKKYTEKKIIIVERIYSGQNIDNAKNDSDSGKKIRDSS